MVCVVNLRRFMPRKVLDMRAARDRLLRQGNQSRTAAGFAGVALIARAAEAHVKNTVE